MNQFNIREEQVWLAYQHPDIITAKLRYDPYNIRNTDFNKALPSIQSYQVSDLMYYTSKTMVSKAIAQKDSSSLREPECTLLPGASRVLQDVFDSNRFIQTVTVNADDNHTYDGLIYVTKKVQVQIPISVKELSVSKAQEKYPGILDLISTKYFDLNERGSKDSLLSVSFIHASLQSLLFDYQVLITNPERSKFIMMKISVGSRDQILRIVHGLDAVGIDPSFRNSHYAKQQLNFREISLRCINTYTNGKSSNGRNTELSCILECYLGNITSDAENYVDACIQCNPDGIADTCIQLPEPYSSYYFKLIVDLNSQSLGNYVLYPLVKSDAPIELRKASVDNSTIPLAVPGGDIPLHDGIRRYVFDSNYVQPGYEPDFRPYYLKQISDYQ